MHQTIIGQEKIGLECTPYLYVIGDEGLRTGDFGTGDEGRGTTSSFRDCGEINFPYILVH